jgi:hypothetical protein
MITFRILRVSLMVLGGKSPAARSSDRAMGVVPKQRTLCKVLRMAGMLLALKGTSSRVSSQSCFPGAMGV